jgi:RNA polymerase sigma factor (TIGR02999 family)
MCEFRAVACGSAKGRNSCMDSAAVGKPMRSQLAGPAVRSLVGTSTTLAPMNAESYSPLHCVEQKRPSSIAVVAANAPFERATMHPVDSSPALFTLVYQELRRMAHSQRRSIGNPVTLDTTALVHEVYLKLRGAPEARSIERVHLLSLAARAMRQILVDHVRTRSRLKRGGDCVITGLADDVGVEYNIVDLVALDAALTALTAMDPRAAQVVEWRIFSGLEIAEIAELQNVGERTVNRDWVRARAFLVQQLQLRGPAP